MLDLRQNFIMTESSRPTFWRGKILVVTSHLLTLDSMRSLLEDHLYSVQATQSGEPALQAAREFSPDLIIMDTVIPYQLGLELCQSLKAEESTGHIPVLFVVTSGQPENKEEIFRAGGIDYIARPFRSEELLVRLEIHLTMQRLKAELELERREKARLNQETKQWEQTFTEHVEQRTHELEEALINERSAHLQMVNAARLTTMSKMAALITREMRNPLHSIHQNLSRIKGLVQENPYATEALENALVEIEHLVKKLIDLDQLCKL